MNDHVKRLYEWCHEQRTHAEKALELYDRGVMRFKVNNVDVTEETKASIRKIIENMTNLIERIEADERA